MYTYDDFLREADKAGVTKRFSPEELATAQKSPEFGISMVGLLRDQEQASTAEQRLLATEAANQMRKNYGLQNAPGTTPQVAAGQDNYAGLLDQANAQGSFLYDPEKDPVWSAYKKQYAREGERAGTNAMAQAAAMSGGIPSSYAVTAGQQANNYYAGQMSDIIPELEQNAYQRYLAEQDLKQQEFNNALNLYNVLGYATPEVAEILGIESNAPGAESDGRNPNPNPNPEADDISAVLKEMVPDGVVTEPAYWSMLVAEYGEDALTKAGIRFSGKGGEAPGKSSGKDFTQIEFGRTGGR